MGLWQRQGLCLRAEVAQLQVGGTVAGQKGGGGGGRAEHVLLWVEVMPVEDDAFSGGWGRQWRGRWCRHSCRWSLRG